MVLFLLYAWSPIISSVLLCVLGGYLIKKLEVTIVHGIPLLITGVSGFLLFLFLCGIVKQDPWGFSGLLLPLGWLILTTGLFCFVWSVCVIFAALFNIVTYKWLILAIPLLASTSATFVTFMHERYEEQRMASGMVTLDDVKTLLTKYGETTEKEKRHGSVADKISKLTANKNATPQMLLVIIDNIPILAAKIATRPDLTPTVCQRILDLNDLVATRALANNLHLPSDMFLKLRQIGDREAIENLAENRSTPFSVLEGIYWGADISFGARLRIAALPQATPRVADDFIRKTFASGSANEKREATTEVHSCSEKLLVELAGSDPSLKEALDSNLAYRKTRRELEEVARLKALLPTLLKGQRPLQESGAQKPAELPFRKLTKYGITLQYPKDWEVTYNCYDDPRKAVRNPHICLRPKGWLASEQVLHFCGANYPFVLVRTNEVFADLANAYWFQKKGGQWIWMYGTYEHPAITVSGDNWSGLLKESEEEISLDKKKFLSNEAKEQGLKGTTYKREVVIEGPDKKGILITAQDMDVDIYKRMLESVHIQ